MATQQNNQLTIRIPTKHIVVVATLLIVVYILQSMILHVYSDNLDSFDWFFEGLQPLISFGLWAVLCPVLYRYFVHFYPPAQESTAGKLRALQNGILVAGIHRLLSMVIFWVSLYLFTDAYIYEAYFDQALQLFGTGLIESILVFAIIVVIMTAYNAYQEKQIELFDIQRARSQDVMSEDDAPWNRDDREKDRGFQGTSGFAGSHLLSGPAAPRNALVQSMGAAPILLNPRRGMYVDQSVVAPQFFDKFHSLLSEEQRKNGLTVGVISPNPKEGKTLVASNLAVSLALGYQKKTILMDFNVRQPALHHIFDVALSPGLVEAVDESLGKRIHVSSTPIKGLFVLTAGGVEKGSSERAQIDGEQSDYEYDQANGQPAITLEQSSAFFEVIDALEREFECIVIDMPSANRGEFPALLSTRLDQFLAVVDTTKTKHRDIEQMMTHVNEDQLMGFVMNQA